MCLASLWRDSGRDGVIYAGTSTRSFPTRPGGVLTQRNGLSDRLRAARVIYSARLEGAEMDAFPTIGGASGASSIGNRLRFLKAAIARLAW